MWVGLVTTTSAVATLASIRLPRHGALQLPDARLDHRVAFRLLCAPG